MAPAKILINRAPVLTLWASVVAERLGFDKAEALSLGKAVAGLTAQTKGRRLGIFTPSPEAVRAERQKKRGETLWVELCGRVVPAAKTAEGVRAVVEDKPIEPAGVERYLRSKFEESLAPARQAMKELAASLPPAKLARRAFGLYEELRPAVPEGVTGWGAKGELDLARVRDAAGRGR